MQQFNKLEDAVVKAVSGFHYSNSVGKEMLLLKEKEGGELRDKYSYDNWQQSYFISSGTRYDR